MTSLSRLPGARQLASTGGSDDIPPGMSMKRDEVLPANAVEIRRLAVGHLGEDFASDGRVEAYLPADSA